VDFIEPGSKPPKMYMRFSDFKEIEQRQIRKKFSKNGDVEKGFFRRTILGNKCSFAMYAGSLSL
jgi:hypothetical protein